MNSFNGAPENAQRKGTPVTATALMLCAFGSTNFLVIIARKVMRLGYGLQGFL